MNMRLRIVAVLGLSLLGIIAAAEGVAQTSSAVALQQRDLSGPRLGLTYVPGHGKLSQTLEANDVGRLISQFGWHFEYQVLPQDGGPAFVVQSVPMLAGVEYGKVIPSMTLAMGIRFPGGGEFGMGPNFIVVKEDDPVDLYLRGHSVVKVKSALVIAIGRSFNYGGVSIPVNLVTATNREGNRFSVIVGYAIQRSARKI